MPPHVRLSDRVQVIYQARVELERRPLYLDTETTGLEKFDEIVEICILDYDGGVLVDSLVKPRHPIPPDVVRIHGITNDLLSDAPAWPEVWERAHKALAGRRVAIYNADFDLRMMKQSHSRHGLRWEPGDESFFCLMKMYARFYGEWNPRYSDFKWYSLEAAAQHCAIPLPPRVHRAQEDAKLARAVLEHMAGA